MAGKPEMIAGLNSATNELEGAQAALTGAEEALDRALNAFRQGFGDASEAGSDEEVATAIAAVMPAVEDARGLVNAALTAAQECMSKHA